MKIQLVFSVALRNSNKGSWVGLKTWSCLVHLDVDEDSIDGAEWLLDDEVELQLLRQLQLVVEGDLRGILLVDTYVVDEDSDGCVELLNLAHQVHTSLWGKERTLIEPVLLNVTAPCDDCFKSLL